MLTRRIEAACYFLASPESHLNPHRDEFKATMDELVDLIVSAQQPDGYLNIYFVVVDPEGK